MRYALFVLGVAAFSAIAWAEVSSDPPPEAYLNPIDQEVARTGEPIGDRTAPCTILKSREVVEGNTVEHVEWLPTDQCVRMSKPRRFVGLWRNHFEGSQFCAVPATECSIDTIRQSAWLNWNRRMPWDRRGSEEFAPDRKLYRVEFIGRQTEFAAGYGHFGLFPHEVIVDRMISVREIKERKARK